MRRRDFIILLAGAMGGWPSALRAQQRAMPLIGFLWSSPGPWTPFVAAFREVLSETGYVEGQNLAVEYRWTEGHVGSPRHLPSRRTRILAHRGRCASRSRAASRSSVP